MCAPQNLCADLVGTGVAWQALGRISISCERPCALNAAVRNAEHRRRKIALSYDFFKVSA